MKHSLSYNHRLHQQSDFGSALKLQAISEKWLAMYVKPNNQGFNRLGIIVSKRIIPKAAKRNRIKRVVRDVFRLDDSINSCSLDVVIRLRKRLLIEETKSFRQTLSRLLKKARNTQNETPAAIDNKVLSILD